MDTYYIIGKEYVINKITYTDVFTCAMKGDPLTDEKVAIYRINNLHEFLESSSLNPKGLDENPEELIKGEYDCLRVYKLHGLKLNDIPFLSKLK